MQLDHIIGGEYGRQLIDRFTIAVRFKNVTFKIEVRISHGNTEQESVELAFGKDVGPLVFKRVLGSHNKEGARQVVRPAVDAALMISHGLK